MADVDITKDCEHCETESDRCSDESDRNCMNRKRDNA